MGPYKSLFPLQTLVVTKMIEYLFSCFIQGYDESLLHQGPKIFHSRKIVLHLASDYPSTNLPFGSQAYLETLTTFRS